MHPKPLVVQVDAGSGTIKLVGLVNSLSDVGVRPAAAPCLVAIAAVPCHSCYQCTHIVLSSGERRKCAGRGCRRRMAQHDQGVASAAAVTGPYRDDDPSHARGVSISTAGKKHVLMRIAMHHCTAIDDLEVWHPAR